MRAVRDIDLLPTRLLEVDGHSLRYHSQGEGPDLVLMHGFPETLQAWTEHAGILGGHWRVHAFDWMGLGGSDAPEGFDYSFEGYGRLIGAVMDRLRIQQAHLVATDIGMPPALLYAVDHPDRVRSLCVFDGPAFERAGHYSWEIHALRTPPFGELMVGAFPRTMFWFAMQRGFHGEPSLAPDVLEDFRGQVRRPRCREVALQLFRSYRPALARIEREVHRIRLPLCVLWGKNDVFDSVETAYELQRACPHARVRVAPECGHFLAHEAPEFFIDQLTEFVAQAG